MLYYICLYLGLRLEMAWTVVDIVFKLMVGVVKCLIIDDDLGCQTCSFILVFKLYIVSMYIKNICDFVG